MATGVIKGPTGCMVVTGVDDHQGAALATVLG